jgi:hypothetical protein
LANEKASVNPTDPRFPSYGDPEDMQYDNGIVAANIDGQTITVGQITLDPSKNYIADRQPTTWTQTGGLIKHSTGIETLFTGISNSFATTPGIIKSMVGNIVPNSAGGVFANGLPIFKPIAGTLYSDGKGGKKKPNFAQIRGYPVQGKPPLKPGEKRTHGGWDIYCPIGTPVFAIADGTVIAIKEGPAALAKGGGVRITIAHSSNPTWYSFYAHLSENTIRVLIDTPVKGNQQIACSGATGIKSSLPHLHLETFKGSSRSKLAYDPTSLYPRVASPPTTDVSNRGAKMGPSANFDAGLSVMNKSIAAYQASISRGQAFRMVRAYPTFKFYFIEDDSEDRKRLGIDDFFSYNAVKSIRCVRSRKIAADLCILDITNVSGNLSNRKFKYNSQTTRDKFNPSVKKDKKGVDPLLKDPRASTENALDARAKDSSEENPIASIMLQVGHDVELRLGYCVDEETEILTQNGWLKHNELKEGDIALTLNHNTGLSEWQPVEKINRFYQENTESVLIDGHKHSSLTTLNHKWPVLSRVMIKGKYTRIREWATSEELKSKHILIGGAKHKHQNRKVWSDAFVELVAWFWTEGEIGNKGINRTPTTIISQSITSNPENVDRITKVLTELYGKPVSGNLSTGSRWKGIKRPRWRKCQRNGRDEVTFRLNIIASADLLKVAPNKIVTREFILQLTESQLELFINISNKGDGHYSKIEEGTLIVSQKNPLALDALELAAILVGYRTSRHKKPSITRTKTQGTYYMDQLYISRKPYIWLDTSIPRKVLHTGLVWCPTTSNSSWLARRKGYVYYTGNSNDPAKLATVFVGKVMEVEFNETEDLVTIVCQSHAMEMVQSIKGLEEPEVKGGGGSSGSVAASFAVGATAGAIGGSFIPIPILGTAAGALVGGLLGALWGLGIGAFYNRAYTHFLLEDMMAQEEMRHFGRWIRSRTVNTDTQKFRSILKNSFSLTPEPQDDNIFPPPLADMEKLDSGWFFKEMQYMIYQTTIWDVFKEMTLRHPSYIASPVPYRDRNGPRMTMFFGLPEQLYFSRDPTPEEAHALSSLQTTSNEVVEKREKELQDKMHDPSHSIKKLKDNAAADLYKRTKELATEHEIIKPFRAYHLVTSDNHIIYNNIRASSKDVFNTVSIQYGKGEYDDDAKDVKQESTDTWTEKFDGALPDEEIREMFAQYANCENEMMAARYSKALLADSIKDTYKGELVIIGNPDIKPYDIVYVMDTYSNMVGPIEVEQVTHVFSQETGFITEIVPDLFCTINGWTSMTMMDVMGMVIEGSVNSLAATDANPIIGAVDRSSLLRKEIKGAGVAIAAGAIVLGGPLSLAVAGAGAVAAGIFMSNKLVDFSSSAHAILLNPLVHNGRPLMAGLPIAKLDNSWKVLNGQWVKDGTKGAKMLFEDVYDKLQWATTQGSWLDMFDSNPIGPQFE